MGANSLTLRILKRLGLLVLGVYFWFQMLFITVGLVFVAAAILKWQHPEWVDFVVSIHIGSSYLSLIYNLLLGVVTIAIGWFYVFRDSPKSRWTVIGLVLIFNLAWAGVPHLRTGSLPSDEELLANFHDHEDEFNRLVEMFITDERVEVVDEEITIKKHLGDDFLPGGKSELPPKRWEEYQELLGNLGLNYGIFRMKPTEFVRAEILFRAGYEQGIFTTGTKGYAYAIEPLSPLVSSLDDAPYQYSILLFRKINDRWYLHLMRWNY